MGISSFSELCSTAVLRSINGILAIISSILIYSILKHLRPDISERKATTYTIILALYPLHWFFTFLYYTDVASVSVVLAMYLACLKNQYWFSALLGGISVLIRQTNIIWMLFVACTGAINYSLTSKKGMENLNVVNRLMEESDGRNNTRSTVDDTNLRKRKNANEATPTLIPQTRVHISSSCTSGILEDIFNIFPVLWHLRWEILVKFSPYLAICALFVLFVIWNGSIVLGAKESHAVSPHFAQMLYFGLVSALFMAPIHFNSNQATHLFHSFFKCKMSLLKGIITLALGIVAVHYFSIAHPYLLADNRHYPFYIWRRIIHAHWLAKYLLVPFYIYSWASILDILGKTQRKIWVLVFFCSCAAVLIPAPLIEFRYYTIPFYIMSLHCTANHNQSLFSICITYLATNIFTMFMFLFRPFHWEHEQESQRFIW